MNDNQKWNGYCNYPTWCVALWLDQDTNPLNFFDSDDLGTRLQTGAGREELTEELSDHLRSLCEELEELTHNETSGMFADLMRYAWGQVDFWEIAEYALQDVEV